MRQNLGDAGGGFPSAPSEKRTEAMEPQLYSAYVQILQEELLPAMGCTEPIAATPAPPRRLADLLGQPLLLREEGSGSREILRRSLNRQNLDLGDFACQMELGDMNVLKQMLLRGCGVAFLYEAAVREELAAGTLRELDLADFQESHDITFLWRKGSVFAPRFRQLHALFFPEAAAL